MGPNDAGAQPLPVVVVRSARADDGPTLQRIDLATFDEDVSPAPRPQPGADFFGGRVKPEDVLVAEVDGAVAGYLAVGPHYRLASSAHVVQIRGLAVTPECQGEGVGRRLVSEAVEVAKEHGARRLTLHVLASNETARRLYDSCGFVVEGVQREQFHLRGRYVDDILLALDLTGLRTPQTRGDG
jgi:ribosomal protein S18 acetylase RimI-like enzyme